MSQNDFLEEYREYIKNPVIARIKVPCDSNLGNVLEIFISCRSEDEINDKMQIVRDLGFEPVLEYAV